MAVERREPRIGAAMAEGGVVGLGRLTLSRRERRAGTRRFYRVNQSAIASLQVELAAFWDGGLSRLKRAAERTERRPRRR